MKYFKFNSVFLPIIIVLNFLISDTIVSSHFTSWYFFPGPTQVVAVGLFFLKVIAIQLAVAYGILMPPHNPIYFGRRKRSPRSSSKIGRLEVRFFERILKGLREMDKSDCFVRLICQMNKDGGRRDEYLQVFKLAKKWKKRDVSIWLQYDDALKMTGNCSAKYPKCPLSTKQLISEALIIL